MSREREVREDGMGWVSVTPKTVGVAKAWTVEQRLNWNAGMLRLSPLCGKWFPKGVFKFRTWEEEAVWTREQIQKALARLQSESRT